MKDMRTPPRHKMALLTWPSAWALITLILWALGLAMATWPLPLRTLVLSVFMVVGLTWLYPVPDPRLRGLANSDTLSGRTQFAPVEPQSLVRRDRCPSRGRPSTQSQPGHPCLAPGRCWEDRIMTEPDRTTGAPPEPDLDQMRNSSMAAERTWLAWWRTALVAIAGALAVGRFAPALLDVAAWPYVILSCGYASLAVGLLIVGARR